MRRILAAGWQAGNPGGYEPERQAAEQALRAAYAAFSDWLTGQVASGDAALAYALIGYQRRTLGAMLGTADEAIRKFRRDSMMQCGATCGPSSMGSGVSDGF